MPLYQNEGKKTEKFVLSTSTSDQLKAVLTLTGDVITQAVRFIICKFIYIEIPLIVHWQSFVYKYRRSVLNWPNHHINCNVHRLHRCHHGNYNRYNMPPIICNKPSIILRMWTFSIHLSMYSISMYINLTLHLIFSMCDNCYCIP